MADCGSAERLLQLKKQCLISQLLTALRLSLQLLTQCQYLTASHRQLGGQKIPDSWKVFGNLGDERNVITVEVNNVLTEKKINNVFGVIKGFVDAGTMRYLFNERYSEEFS